MGSSMRVGYVRIRVERHRKDIHGQHCKYSSLCPCHHPFIYSPGNRAKQRWESLSLTLPLPCSPCKYHLTLAGGWLEVVLCRFFGSWRSALFFLWS